VIVYLNGAFLPIEDARIPVLDRGFIYGDGVYEYIPVYRRQAFRLPQHLVRLQHSLDGIRLANPHTDDEWTSIIMELVARQPYDDQGVYFQVTRGVAKRDHAFPAGVTPTVFMMSNPLATPSAEQIERLCKTYPNACFFTGHAHGGYGEAAKKVLVYDFDAIEQYRTVAMVLAEALREELLSLKKFALEHSDFLTHEEQQEAIVRYLTWRNGRRTITRSQWNSYRRRRNPTRHFQRLAA
jgi:hypothetical protein